MCSNTTTVRPKAMAGKAKGKTSIRNSKTERQETDEVKRKARNSRAERRETAVTR